MITAINTYSMPHKKQLTQSKNTTRQNHSSSFDTVSFGNNNKNIPTIQKIFLKIAENKHLKKLVDWAAGETVITKKNNAGEVIDTIVKKNTDKLTQYLMVGFSFFLQGNHVFNIMRNKDIPTERKEVLAVNNALTFVIPTVGAFTVDGAINRGADKFQQYLKDINGKHISDKALDGVKIAKTLLIFTMMYKYASTLIAMPMADGVTRFCRRQGLFGEEGKRREFEHDKEVFMKASSK